MIRLNVFIQVNESNRNAVLETAKELVAQSLNDKGCIAYDIFESATRKDVLMICETWKDAESLDAHEKAAHFITLVPKLQELGKMKLEPYLSDWVKQIQQNSTSDSGTWEKEHTPFFRRLPTIMQEAWGIVRGVLLYILIGIGIGAFMHGYVPEGFFEQYMSKDNWFAVPLSVVLAVPMYANAAGIVPVIEVFVAKGIPIGTALAFMMAVVGLSLPEATLLKKVMTWRLIGIFFGLITLFIIMLGYLYNIVL